MDPNRRPFARRAARLAPLLLLFVVCLGLAAPAQAAGLGAGFAGSTGAAGVSGPPVSSVQPPNTLPGIDVSHYQGTINWTRVASDGIRFAFAKASEGLNYVDPTYATNRDGAIAAGLVVGAYHFARPDLHSTMAGAIAEADHFVDTALPAAGNVLPVLDLERDGDLSPAQLTAWELSFLGEVLARTGVHALVYTSPNHWENGLGDTTEIAEAGYPLWIAHWNVSAPRVPAEDWVGRSWTFWQYSDCGRVPGIDGCVDVDWFNGLDLAAAEIHQLVVSLPAPDGVVTSSPSGISCGTICEANFDPGSTVTLTAVPNPGKAFLGWGGACTGTGACAVTMTADEAVTATFGDDIPPSVTLQTPTDILGAGTATFSEIVHGVTATNVVERAVGAGSNAPATVSCESPRGLTVDCGSGNVISVSIRPIQPLIAAQSYAMIVAPAGSTPPVDRGGNPAPTTELGFTAPAELEQSSPAISYTWATVSNRAAYGRSYAVEHLPGGSASFAFTGRTVTWYTATGPAQGKARVLIDGASEGTFDQFGSSAAFRVARTFRNLPSGDHVITIVALGTKGSTAGTDTQVAIDAFGVGGDVVANPKLDATWHPVRSAGASGGSFAASDLAGASVSFRFAGTAARWTTLRGPNHGRAQIYVDGTLVRTVDDYAPETTFGVVRSVTGLADGVHVLTIVVTGTARGAATGTLVAVDRFAVR